MNPANIEEKLRVFISSAQGNEDDFVWLEFRKKVKEELTKCQYINAFTIENRATTIQSNEFMVYNVEKADIIILLIKNEFRKGTSIEYNHAKKIGKPLLVYFFGDEKSTCSVENLRNDLISNDYCTFCKLGSFDGAEKIIANDVIQDVIVYYQRKHYLQANQENIETLNFSENIDDKVSIPTKTVISYFDTCYDSIFSYLELPSFTNNAIKNVEKDISTSVLHNVGEKILEWLVDGTTFYDENVQNQLIDVASEIYPNTEWYKQRLKAIESAFNGDYLQALNAEKEALILAEREDAAHWIINNILIDLRNLEINAYTKNQVQNLSDEFQKELDESNVSVYMPILDRLLENTFEEILKEEIKRNTATLGTTFFGSNVKSVIANIETYLFSSFLYGSYTHIIITRKYLAIALYRIGNLFCDSDLLYTSMKMYLLSGEYKEFKRLTNYEWTNIHSVLVSKADELWYLADNAEENVKDIVKITALFRVGLYLSDDVFYQAEDYIIKLGYRIPQTIISEYLDCLANLCIRLNQENIIKLLIFIIKSKHYIVDIVVDKLTNLISNVDIPLVSDKFLNELCIILQENMPLFRKQPQFISLLVKCRPDIFKILETVPDNGLTGLEKQVYDINMGNGNWEDILNTEIINARKQFENDKDKEAVVVQYATNPYRLISEIFDEHITSSILHILQKDFFPLCIEIMESDVSLEIKDECAECLCSVIGYFKNNKIKIPDSIIKCINELTPSSNSSFSLTVRSWEGFWCRIVTLKFLVGVINKNVLIEWCSSYSQKNNSERYALAKSLKTYIQYSTNIVNDINELIVSIIFQCCTDDLITIRKISCYCLAYMLKSKFSSLIEEKLYEMVTDPAPAIRGILIYICQNNTIDDKDIKSKLLTYLENDANYRIRKQAKDARIDLSN